jgi:ribosomal protein S6--L-glutamate ligase
VGSQTTIEDVARVALLVEGRYLLQRQPLGLADQLRRRGCTVTVVDPGSTAISLTDDSWLAGIDVCVARGRSEAVLSRLLSAERCAVPTINRHSAVAAVHNKAAMAVALASARIPTPPTRLGTPAQLAADLPSDLYPVIVKPIRGDNCRGLRVCESRDGIARLSAAGEDPLLAQPYLDGDGTDLKLYGVGDRIWAVKKPSPLCANGSQAAGHRGLTPATPVRLNADLRRLALDCSELFGLELFGVDCLLTPDGPVVVEVNEYPNYTGVVEADEALAGHVLARVAGPSRAATIAAEV